MGIRRDYSSPTPTLSHMKLRSKIFTKISTPTLRNGLTLVTTRLVIHMELKQDLIVKCLECLRMKKNIEKRFDTSDYSTSHPYGIKTRLNSKVLGMFKDEAGVRQIVEFVGLRAKLYSYKMLDDSEDKNVRG